MIETIEIPVKNIVGNKGQIKGLPKNPRLIKDEKYRKLVKSIEEDPEMMELRELIVIPHGDYYIAICGNMRLQALNELGIEMAPCKVLPEDTPLQKLKAYTIKDNVGFGEHDWELLANEWDSVELEEWGLDVPTFTDIDYSDKNQEIDTSEYSEKMTLKIELPEDDYHEAINILKGIGNSLGESLMEVLRDRS